MERSEPKEVRDMVRDVLLIATLDGLENCANVLEQQLGVRVEVAAGRREGLDA